MYVSGIFVYTMGDVENARKYFKMSINSSKEYTRIDAYNNLYFLEKDIDNFEEAIIYHEKRIPLSAYWMRSIP